ncbi:MAG: hypothetical protein HC824_07570 [Synechococcales cyanobacterium RM1_1_8]|nr:hypothetical protein [Synechococcales cyanobacterium RM1_1_8]
MKLTISVDGEPAAIEGVLTRIREHLRNGVAVNFKSAIQPESCMGVEGFIDFRSSQSELGAWRSGLDLLAQVQAEALVGQAAVDRLKQEVRAMDLPEEKLLPIFVQLYTMMKEFEQNQDSGTPVPGLRAGAAEVVEIQNAEEWSAPQRDQLPQA